jgi:hypothetical protein
MTSISVICGRFHLYVSVLGNLRACAGRPVARQDSANFCTSELFRGIEADALSIISNTPPPGKHFPTWTILSTDCACGAALATRNKIAAAAVTGGKISPL